MSRSLRKGPYIQESLEKKILALSLFIMETSLFLFTLLRTW